MASDKSKKIAISGKILAPTEYEAIANIENDASAVREAIADFDQIVPGYKGLLRCRQKPRTI